MSKFAIAVALALFAALVAAQEGRGSIPPGEAQDGSRPADGALDVKPIAPDAGRAKERCLELLGTLREECLRKAEDASAGASREVPGGKSGAGELPPGPRVAPPPQNPR